MCSVWSNQKLLIWQSISPLPGIGSGSTTSNAREAVGGDHQQAIAGCGGQASAGRSNTSRTLPRWRRGRPGRSDCEEERSWTRRILRFAGLMARAACAPRARATGPAQCTPAGRGLQVNCACLGRALPDEALVRQIAGILRRRRPAARATRCWAPLIGLLIGHAFDIDWFKLRRDNPYARARAHRRGHRRRGRPGLPPPDLPVPPRPHGRRGRRAAAARPRPEAREINAAYDRIKTLRKKRC